MTKRTAATRRAELREARRAHIEEMRVVAEDEVFGYSIKQRPRGNGLRVQWDYQPGDPFVSLVALQALRTRLLDGLEVELAACLREGGHSWADIGFALEITGEAARKRLAGQVAALLESE